MRRSRNIGSVRTLDSAKDQAIGAEDVYIKGTNYKTEAMASIYRYIYIKAKTVPMVHQDHEAGEETSKERRKLDGAERKSSRRRGMVAIYIDHWDLGQSHGRGKGR